MAMFAILLVYRGERKRLVADRYWLAISRELEANCRCAAFVQRFSDRRSISPSPDPRSLLGCVCSGGQFSQLSDTSAPPTIKPGTIPLDRIPSRIPPLVEELRNILLSLVAPRSPTLCPNSLTSETGSSSASAHELICATLDPAEISQRLERGRRIDMPALARFLGLVLKGHCAPMRDGIVDGMVSLISGEASEFVLEPDFQNAAHDSLQKSRYHGLAGGLRMSFELLELMKLVGLLATICPFASVPLLLLTHVVLISPRTLPIINCERSDPSCSKPLLSLRSAIFVISLSSVPASTVPNDGMLMPWLESVPGPL